MKIPDISLRIKKKLSFFIFYDKLNDRGIGGDYV